jgi:hypothetical protein
MPAPSARVRRPLSRAGAANGTVSASPRPWPPRRRANRRVFARGTGGLAGAATRAGATGGGVLRSAISVPSARSVVVALFPAPSTASARKT